METDTLTALDLRAVAREDFIAANGWAGADIEALPADASFRRYYRIRKNDRTIMLMDAPPERPEEDIRPFIKIGEHLRRMGLSAPRLGAADPVQGFLLLEDFGDDTFTRLLAKGHDEEELLALAVDALIQLHRNPDAAKIDLGHYADKMREQAEWVVTWYLPDVGVMVDDECRQSFRAAFEATIAGLPPVADTLMHRDYHVDNLMLLPGRSGVAACGILDFQDAQLCATPYDLVSLLEDARRDISPELTARLLARYAAALPIDEAFRAWYAALGGVRHMRIIGNFVRLSNRDGKHWYRQHLPRVFNYLNRSLQSPFLQPLAEWRARYMPETQPLASVIQK